MHKTMQSIVAEREGNGSEVLLLFHGYGQDIHAYDEVLPGIPENYTRYHFHLPGHGKSTQAVHQPFDKRGLKAYFEYWFKENGVSTFSLAGYSLGGKMALLLAEFFPDRIRHLILIAPDGIKPDYADLFLNRNVIGRGALKFLHKNPSIIRGSLGIAKKTGIIHEKVYRFFLEQSTEPEARLFVMNTWRAFRKLRPDVEKVLHGLSKVKDIKIMLIYGRSDKILPAVYMRKFASRMNGIVVREMPGGHQLLNMDIAPLFKEFLIE
jgi:pimeloyl-ACP methyl ester carboxylesterase